MKFSINASSNDFNNGLKSAELDCFCDLNTTNKFNNLLNNNQCRRTYTDTEERITCWEGDRQFITVKPLNQSNNMPLQSQDYNYNTNTKPNNMYNTK
jgi:hypothetical protein